MTYQAIIPKFLEKIADIKSTNPSYKQPGDGSNGVCDCIGLIIGAIRRLGLTWSGIHGSNYAARYATDGLAFISNESDLALGDLVYKAANQDGTLTKACGLGTIRHKWDLPSRYAKGNKYYNGDMKDYYHVGVVTQVNPLRITHMTSPHMKVDTNLSGGWNYHGKAKPLVLASGKSVPESKPIPGAEATPDTPSTGSEAIVVSGNGGAVKMREYPSTSCRTWIKLAPGTKVTIVEPGEQWAKISGGGRKGWYMMAEFLDIIGDGKGQY